METFKHQMTLVSIEIAVETWPLEKLVMFKIDQVLGDTRTVYPIQNKFVIFVILQVGHA